MVIYDAKDADEIKCMEWLHDGRNDIIINDDLLSGYEWPSIVWIGPLGPTQDIIMRAVLPSALEVAVDKRAL